MMPLDPRIIADSDIRIDPNGEIHKMAPADGEAYTLEELQAAVEGYIEVVPGLFSAGHIGLANEEGLLQGLDYNQTASELFQRELVGSIAVIRNERMR
jgi:hypothetical protein